MCRSRKSDLGSASAGILLLVAAFAPARAYGQACCAGGSVVNPARLASHEDVGVGMQLRARSNVASFAADGRYISSSDAEQVLEQDLIASVRVTERGQVGVLLPSVQTHRNAAGVDDWGGGIGDLSVSGRYDVLLAAETVHAPGIGLLAAVTAPTGTSPDRATHALAADATGAGTFDATLGVALEEVSGHWYAALNGWVTHRFARSVPVVGGPTLTETFSARWTLQAVGGYVFLSQAALALFLTSLNEGPATIDGARDPATSLRLTTAGAAAVLPLWQTWRLQGSTFFDLPVASFGRNEPAGYGLAASLVRIWM